MQIDYFRWTTTDTKNPLSQSEHTTNTRNQQFASFKIRWFIGSKLRVKCETARQFGFVLIPLWLAANERRRIMREKLHLQGAQDNDLMLFELIGYKNIGQSNLE